MTLVDLAVAFALAEACALAWHHHATGRGLPARDWLPNLAAGLALMLALRAAALPWQHLALWLTLAGAAHALDLRQRWLVRRGPPAPG